jgi:hypothetical protein
MHMKPAILLQNLATKLQLHSSYYAQLWLCCQDMGKAQTISTSYFKLGTQDLYEKHSNFYFPSLRMKCSEAEIRNKHTCVQKCI